MPFKSILNLTEEPSKLVGRVSWEIAAAPVSLTDRVQPVLEKQEREVVVCNIFSVPVGASYLPFHLHALVYAQSFRAVCYYSMVDCI